MENNTKIMTVVYADNIGLVLQGGVTEIITIQDTGHDDGDTLLRTESRNIFADTNGLRAITGCCKLFVTIQRTTNIADTYAVDPYDEISFLDGKMYFTDTFSGEDRVENINDLMFIKTEL